MKKHAYAGGGQGSPAATTSRRRRPAVASRVRPAQDASADRGGGIQSIQRACSLLAQIARSRDGIGLAELSRRVGLHPSTTFHIAKTLVNLGYLRQIETSRCYCIGRELFTLAAAAIDEVRLVNIAGSVLADLSQVTGETTYFGVTSGEQLVIIAKHEGAGAIRINDSLGNIRPKHCTALGKIILAAMPQDKFEAFLSREDLASYTPKTITSRERLRKEIGEVRKSWVAFDEGEFNAELHCVAVPVLDFTGRVIGSLGVSGPAWRLSVQALQRQIASARRAAERLSAELGYRAEPAPQAAANT
jgi:IclR family transcriptional regulator, KDG regulon repressor